MFIKVVSISQAVNERLISNFPVRGCVVWYLIIRQKHPTQSIVSFRH